MSDRPFPHDRISTLTDAPDAERLAALAALYPEAMTEGRVDLTKLAAQLTQQGAAATGPERYSFSWAGKRDAIRAAQTPSAATLIPEPAQSVDFATTRNLFIEGDNLEVLKLLHRAYFGRVKMIYIDPPYNTGNDFVYPDDYSDPLGEYLRVTGQRDASGNLLTTNPESSGRYHSAWLSMMYPRLALARSFLREDGVIFVSIDDHEVHNLRLLMNEIFGEENFVATVIWQKIFSPKNSARYFSEDHDYVLVYTRSIEMWTPRSLPRTEAADARYSNPDNDPRGVWTSSDLTARNYYGEGQYDVVAPNGVVYKPVTGRYWVVNKQRFDELNRDHRIWWGESGSNMPRQKRFLSEVRQGIVPQTLWEYEDVGHTQEAKKELLEYVAFENTDNVLDSVKPVRLLRRMLQIATTPESGDIVLDFFSGSATTAHAVLAQNVADSGNRRFICVQLPVRLPIQESVLHTIADIGKERIRRVIARMRQADEGTLGLSTRDEPEDLGFRVFRLAPASARSWQPPSQRDADAWLRQMELTGAPISADAADRDLIWEAAIREGYSLTSRVERANPGAEPPIWRVSDPDRGQSFTLCLAPRITLEPLRALGLTRDDLFICRETALDDTTGANLALQCRLKTL